MDNPLTPAPTPLEKVKNLSVGNKPIAWLGIFVAALFLAYFMTIIYSSIGGMLKPAPIADINKTAPQGSDVAMNILSVPPVPLDAENKAKAEQILSAKPKPLSKEMKAMAANILSVPPVPLNVNR